jgi:hypothetical protein
VNDGSLHTTPLQQSAVGVETLGSLRQPTPADAANDNRHWLRNASRVCVAYREGISKSNYITWKIA